MDSSLSSHQEIFTGASDASSPATLLERGMHCIHQGYYIEGVTYFARAREGLPPAQLHLAAALDALIQSHLHYEQAQQALHLASRHFVEADTERQTQFIALEKLLPAFKEEALYGVSQPRVAAQPINTFKEQKLPQPPPSPSTDSNIGQLSPQPSFNKGNAGPELHITCFGRFEVRRLGRPIELCASRSGQSILRYVVAKPGHYASSDTLQALLWPEDEPEVAQHKLHIAISALRRSLGDGSPCKPRHGYIICKNHVYYLDPSSTLHTDVDEFLSYYQAGQQNSDERITYFEKACQLYTGPFLTEDIYADWSLLQREQLSHIYLGMCRALTDHYLQIKRYEDATKWATAILTENRCDEAAHQQLMRIYAAQGRRHEALQQYQRCVRLLHDEIGVEPLPETAFLSRHLLAIEDAGTSKEKP